MEFVNAQMLEACRDTHAASLPGTAVIWRPTFAVDAIGGGSTSWANVGTVDARLAPMGAVERSIGLRWATVGDWVVTLDFDADVRQIDRIVMQGKTLEVRGIPKDRTWEICRRAICVEAI